ncbi:hypothetical protein V8F20_010115 [Naviculisporaceae sp. PSN 640]
MNGRGPCIRCERKSINCRLVPKSKECKACINARAKCFRADPQDTTKLTPLIDNNTSASFETLGKFHLALLYVAEYDKQLQTDTKQAKYAIVDISKAGRPREATQYVVDISWTWDLIAMANRFKSAVESFLESSAAAKAKLLACRTNPASEITEKIKNLKFGFFEEDEEGYRPEPPRPSSSRAGPAPVLTEEELAEYKIDLDTAEVMLVAYNSLLKLFNLAADPLERVVKEHGIAAKVRYRGDEHMNLGADSSDDEDDSNDEEDEEEPEPTTKSAAQYKNAKARHKAKRKAEKRAEDKASFEAFLAETRRKRLEAGRKLQVLGAGDLAQIVSEAKVEARQAFENAMKECVEIFGFEAARTVDDKAQKRYCRLLDKREKDGY